ncbi:MAG: alkaline phosphatase family protein [Gemmatimonadaceae bacterium]|nr:alkaline phosphatase family protein [Gemmatimonadaceae bacterium]
MTARPLATRVILVVLDGLRPDAIDAFDLQHCRALMARSAWTDRGTSVAPSVTAAALTSMFTGVSPDIHGVDDDKFRLPKAPHRLSLITNNLLAAGLPTAVHVRRVPWLFRALASRMARYAGAAVVSMKGDTAPEILDAAEPTLARRGNGFVFVHLPDADRVGHIHGWMSPQYGRAAQTLDQAVGRLVHEYRVLDDPGTLLIACADHGGGGAVRTHHNSAHPDDRTIPVMLAGAGVVPGRLQQSVHWLDLPATVLWSLGVAVPLSWQGAPLTAAFSSPKPPVAVAHVAA